MQGAVRNTLTIVWVNEEGTPTNLTDATLTGTIKPATGAAERAITGELAIVAATSGVFTWAPSNADVAEKGNFAVQFNAAYASGATPAKSPTIMWTVKESN